ncbi:MAG: YfcE family phosphodiesterase [Clostridia bacterium]|nr:YfcE family phosphodiesterase [Clostridia bacterium]MBQ5893060.1 YfcE family phosphodiesterase [Clostridia bacterium]
MNKGTPKEKGETDMELLVISDAHGNRAAICEALRRQVRPPDALLFLGDGLRDLPDLPDGRTALYAVAGNCDGYLPFFTEGEEREICLLSLGEHRLLLTHGHRFGVKSGCGALLAYAAQEGADIVLYGHTHLPHAEVIPAGTALGGLVTERPIYLFNPGSIGQDVDGKGYSFGTVTLLGKSALLSHGRIPR